MSGTSIDGIDAALVSIQDGATQLLHTHTQPYSEPLRQAVFDLATARRDDLHTLASLDRQVGLAFAEAAEALIASAGEAAHDIVAIGSHGQTARHHPVASANERYSLQIGDPATIAEVTGITTVADFRRGDIAAGGEGAPLTPLFHAAQFAHSDDCRAVVNIGGISNATLLRGPEVIAGFDCGPGNTLLDNWIRHHRGEHYDIDGAWSAEHRVIPALFEALSNDAFFTRKGASSTGPEYFNLRWLDQNLSGDEKPGDVQATLAELTAFAIVDSLEQSQPKADAVFVCGGGARNTDLMRRLHRRLDEQRIRLGTTDELGLAAEWVEASAFAWLAHRALKHLPGNAPVVTGARGERVLGAIHYGSVPHTR